MGYGHGWRIGAKWVGLLEERLPAILEDFQKLLPHLPPLAGPMGWGKPLLDKGQVAFNGHSPQDYESFLFPQGGPSGGEDAAGFCKTGFSLAEARPYDLAVKAFLLLAKWHLGEAVRLRSDGDLADWAGAAHLVEGVLLLPSDPFWALDRTLLGVEDRQGRPFALEAGRGKEEATLRWLEGVGLPHLPYAPPYRVLGEVHLPLEALPRLRVAGGVYRMEGVKGS